MILTSRAIEEIRRIDQGTTLRISVSGGGCSGMVYQAAYETTPAKPDDKIITQDGITLHIDPKSMLFLKGTELDFSGGLNGTGFTFNNPNAKRTCGCGSSFST